MKQGRAHSLQLVNLVLKGLRWPLLCPCRSGEKTLHEIRQHFQSAWDGFQGIHLIWKHWVGFLLNHEGRRSGENRGPGVRRCIR